MLSAMPVEQVRSSRSAADPGTCLTAVLAADETSVRDGLIRMMASPSLSGVGEDLRATAEIVLAEVLNNVVEHAYAQGPGDIELSLDCRDDGVAVCITDSGLPMPGGALPEGRPQVLGAIPDLPEGGFGWFLIRSMTRDLTYRREGGRNRLCFIIPPDRG
jgi:serine/threonine-protein kinase RsbW